MNATRLKCFIKSSGFKEELATIIKEQNINLSPSEIDSIYEQIQNVSIKRLNSQWLLQFIKTLSVKVHRELPFTYRLLISQNKLQTIIRKICLAIIARSKTYNKN